MSQILQDIQVKFGVSEPIFNVSLAKDKSEIRIEVQNQYKPPTENITDPVEKFMAERYEEHYDRRAKRWVKDDICQNTYRAMVEVVCDTYVTASPLKNPRQSNMYKWLRGDCRQYGHICNDGFIMLYRYIENNRNVAGRFDGGRDNKCLKNLLGILEKMKEKYERK